MTEEQLITLLEKETWHLLGDGVQSVDSAWLILYLGGKLHVTLQGHGGVGEFDLTHEVKPATWFRRAAVRKVRSDHPLLLALDRARRIVIAAEAEAKALKVKQAMLKYE